VTCDNKCERDVLESLRDGAIKVCLRMSHQPSLDHWTNLTFDQPISENSFPWLCLLYYRRRDFVSVTKWLRRDDS
jgi:hypothetical protein